MIEVLALIVLFVMSIQDLKVREVPDILNYGFIVAVLVIKLMYSIFLSDWSIILYSFYGFLAMFVFGWLIYFTGQFGGGDCKLLMGMGAVIGFNVNLLYFLGLLLVIGGIYGVVYLTYLIIKNWSKVSFKFSYLYLSWFFIMLLGWFDFMFFLLGLVGLFSHIFFIISMMVEKKIMVKWYPVSKLTEGDWLAKSVFVDGCEIKGAIEGADLDLIKKNFSKVLVKEGIPFIPAFFLAYLLFLMFSNYLAMIL